LVSIVEARQQTYQAVNAALTMTYWRIGERIRREILKKKRSSTNDPAIVAGNRMAEGGRSEAVSIRASFGVPVIIHSVVGKGLVGALNSRYAGNDSGIPPEFIRRTSEETAD
jgi:hypothetical protein